MGSLPDLTRRMSRKIEQGKTIMELEQRMSDAIANRQGMMLTEDERQLLEDCGALATLRAYYTPRLGPICHHCCPTWIYFIQAGEGGPIKIGLAKDVEARRTGHQTSNHEHLTVLAVRKGTGATETELHHFFGAEHRRGEWFNPSMRLLAYIESLAS